MAEGAQSYFQMVNTPNCQNVVLAFGGLLFVALSGYMAHKLMKKSDKQTNSSRKEYKAMNKSQLKTPALA